VAPLSLLDLAIVSSDATVRDALDSTVALAQTAERCGYTRVWYAEHHNMSAIASSATSVLIAHIAANTQAIRLGSGGIMLPNHSPLVIAEQFGTLSELHPGRIDLGLGRAPGTDQPTVRALRRDPRAAETFPDDVVELQAFLAVDGHVGSVRAIPGRGTKVPLYILGSSTFGAQVAALLGLPFAFASHFAPPALQAAVRIYRAQFRPSEQLGRSHVIAAVNAIADDTESGALAQLESATRARVARFLGGDRRLSESEVDALLDSPQGQQVLAMMRHRAVGTPPQVRAHLEEFREFADADELMIVLASPSIDTRLRSAELIADAMA
jgi:luciferase family oxidoreductase group 1